MKIKFNISSILAQLLLLSFVIVWIAPTFGLFISSFRDKDKLAISGWWTSLTTVQVNEIYRTKGKEGQVKEDDYFIIRDNFFNDKKGKKVINFGVTSKNINEFIVGNTAILKDKSEIKVFENGDYEWRSKKEFTKKKGRRIFVTASSPPNFTFDNYKEVLFKEGLGQAFLNTIVVALPSTLIPLTICSFFAYALAWMKFFGRDILLASIIASLVVPLQMSLIPILTIYNDFGALFGVAKILSWHLDGAYGIWFASTTFLLWNFLKSLNEMMEAAKVDGATHYDVFTENSFTIINSSFCINFHTSVSLGME